MKLGVNGALETRGWDLLWPVIQYDLISQQYTGRNEVNYENISPNSDTGSQARRRHSLGLNHRQQGVAQTFECGSRAACREAPQFVSDDMADNKHRLVFSIIFVRRINCGLKTQHCIL